MQPTSWATIGVTALVTIAVAAFTIWSWNWPRLRYGRRTVLLLITQVLVVITVLAVINHDQTFFTTWSEIFGTEEGNVQVTTILGSDVWS